ASELLLGHAGTGVRDGEPHLALGRGRADQHGSLGRRELEGVADEVRQDLVDAMRIAMDQEISFDLNIQGEPLLGGERPGDLGALLNERHDLAHLPLEDDLASLDDGEVEEVADEALHALGRAPDGLGWLARPLWILFTPR